MTAALRRVATIADMKSTTRLAALCLALLLVACDSKATPPPTQEASASSVAPASTPAGTVGPAATGAPSASGGPTDGGVASARDLPIPTISDPFAIGQALYDPSQMADGLVSLLTLMGVGTYRDDGTPINTGDVTKAGDPWLFQSEVWGLVDMGIADLNDAGDAGPTFRLKDLYDALRGSLPSDLSLDAFIRAYADSYAAHPDDLAPSVLLGQPVDASTPLTRVQLWLLYMDGFVDLAPALSADVRDGPIAAAARPRSGTAHANLPALIAAQTLTPSEWRELLPHFMTVVEAIPFQVDGNGVHEGHGSTGQPAQISAQIRRGAGFVSPVSGAVLLRPATGPMNGIEVTWRSPDVATYAEHGTLSASIPGTAMTDASGVAAISYTPKKEIANGQGALSHDAATISATVGALDLLLHAYGIDDQSLLAFFTAGTLGRSRTATDSTQIGWHGPGIEVTITNVYDVTFDAAQGIGGTVAVAHRIGTDTFQGTLTKRSDGTYRGVVEAHTAATSQMAFGAGGLVGDRCDDSTDIVQQLTVVGKLQPLGGLVDSDFEVIDTGQLGGQVLILTFTPRNAPSDEGKCQRSVAYFTTNVNGIQVLAGWYASFSDSRITDPSLGGYRVLLPATGKQLAYSDERQAAKNLPAGTGVDATWTIHVDRQVGS